MRSWIAVEWTITRIGSPSVSTRGVDLADFHLLAGVVTHLVVFTAPFPPISPIGCRERPPKGWPRGPSVHATPYATRPRSSPRFPRAGTCGRCCRPSSGAESRRAAASATDSRCAAGKEWRSSPHVRLARSPAGYRPRDQRLKPRPLCIPQIARISVALPPISPAVLLRPHCRSPSR